MNAVDLDELFAACERTASEHGPASGLRAVDAFVVSAQGQDAVGYVVHGLGFAAELLEALERSADAVDRYDAALVLIDEMPSSIEALHTTGYFLSRKAVLLEALDRLPEARQTCERIVELCNGRTSDDVYSDGLVFAALALKGRLLECQHDDSGALAAFDGAIAIATGSPEVGVEKRDWLLMARSRRVSRLRALGRPVDALAELERVIADAQAELPGTEAERVYRARIAVIALRTRAAVLMDLGRVDEAKLTIDALRERAADPDVRADVFDAFLDLGRTLPKLGEAGLALSLYEVIRASPDPSEEQRRTTALALLGAFGAHLLLGEDEQALAIKATLEQEYAEEALAGLAAQAVAKDSAESLQGRTNRAVALYHRAWLLRELGRDTECKAQVRELRDEYGVDPSSEINALLTAASVF